MKQFIIITILFFLCYDAYNQNNDLSGTSWELTKELEYKYSDDTLYNRKGYIHFIDNEKMAFSNTKTLDSLDYVYNYRIKKNIFSKYNTLIFSSSKQKIEIKKKWDFAEDRSWSCSIKIVNSTNLILAYPIYEDSWMKFYEKIE
ncbi:MAG: hypothetical protein K0B10_07030 [Vicingaceae bacterium]|nr:hypothetical protein [Vicingaceae bacterium]